MIDLELLESLVVPHHYTDDIPEDIQELIEKGIAFKPMDILLDDGRQLVAVALTEKGDQTLYRMREDAGLSNGQVVTCKHGTVNCGLLPTYTPVKTIDGVLMPDPDGRCTDWVVGGFMKLSAICEKCQDELRSGDHVQDNGGRGMHLSVNKCWGCGKVQLGHTLILVPNFCSDCSRKQAGRKQIYSTYEKLGLLTEARNALQKMSDEPVEEDDVYYMILGGWLGDSLDDSPLNRNS